MKELILSDPLPDVFQDVAGDRFEVVHFADARATQRQSAAGIIVYGHMAINDALLDRCPNVRVISNHGVGTDHIDVAAMKVRGIPVGNTPGCLDASTADMTIALMLATARNVVVGDHFARGNAFEHYDPRALIGYEVTGSTLGIVGMGRIGLEVAKRAKAFEMPILYHNRNRRPDAEATFDAQYCELDELLERSDFVSLNCPLKPETTHLIARPQLERMKSTAILINVARGGVVNTNDLLDALQNKQIAAAGLDVTDPEPLPRDHPLLGLDNVVITPHLGSASDRTRRRMMEMTIANLDAGLKGEPLPTEVA